MKQNLQMKKDVAWIKHALDDSTEEELIANETQDDQERMLLEAEQDIREGNVLSSEELLREIETWEKA